MPDKWKIKDVGTRTIGDTPCWEVLLERPDGTLHAHIMPTVTLEWRAAEYGIDPADVDALLAIVLHEPWMPLRDDGAGPRYADDGPDLWQADNTDTARTAHLARVQACPIRIDVAGVKALDSIRNSHRPDPEQLRAMREAVDTTRWLTKYGDLPAKPLPQNPAVQKEAARA